MKDVLFCCSSFYPSYKSGGPVRSLCNLVDVFGNSIVIDVITKDRDMGDGVSFSNVNLNSWSNRYHNANVFYLSPEYSFIANVKNIFKNKKYDVLYLNSFFDAKFSIRFLLLTFLQKIKTKEILLAPRGELTNGAMSLKPIKKNVYLFLFKLFRFHKKVKFHFTSKQEAKEALHYLGNVEYILAPNMHEPYPDYTVKKKEIGFLNLIFLSRISPKKNLIVILNALSNIENGQVNFTIAGAIDDQTYWEKCEKLIDNLPENINVYFLGSINREQVVIELRKSHVFFLPTLNENYGHAIVEAMVSSNVLIISNQTPWSEVSDCGSFVGSVNDVSYYSSCLRKLIMMDENEYNENSRLTYGFCENILIQNVIQIKNMFN